MSEIADTPVPVPASAVPDRAVPTVHEAYSFACMRCGYGWEQAYEIEHHVDGTGRPFIMYTVQGERVPSPLSSPTCLNCGGHVVRIMRAGQVDSVLGVVDRLFHHNIAPGIAGPVPSTGDDHERGRHRRGATHDGPGPVAVTEADRAGMFARLRARFSRGSA
ncbi:hypothetical protein [Streptomyces sp. NPDC097619]|uniref:hypothetical protein n=1 Tax=Streptomyces sp. NPDC097619 TaxID=3157228 RepID=UPI003316E8DF